MAAAAPELAAAAEREREREARAHPCPRPTLVRRHTHHCLTQSPPSARQAALAALQREHAALQRDFEAVSAERDGMVDDLKLLDEDFFSEVEDLKYRFHQASQRLEQYEQQFGPI